MLTFTTPCLSPSGKLVYAYVAYSVIRMNNMLNEPNGNWMWPGGKVDYAAWASGIRNLRKELDAHGLQQLPIVGPDCQRRSENGVILAV